MSASSFTIVNRRLEEERRKKYCGTGSLRLTSLQYREYEHSADDVSAMERIFRQEQGCRKEDNRHHVKALISQQVLKAAIDSAEIPIERLIADDLPYPELEFPAGVKIECIEGHDRLAAADRVLQGSKKRWVVDLYIDDLSNDLRTLLADGYDYQKKPDDGESYIAIRQFQGYHGEMNPFFEKIWLARLAKNSKKLFDQLSSHKKFSAAFDELLDIPGLFGGFRLSVIHQLLGMKCTEAPNLTYLKHIYTWWSNICAGDKTVMRQVTRDTVEALQGMAPGTCTTDHNELLVKLKGGGIFENFSASQREELWQRTCSTSQRCLIPSLYTFFEDRKYFSDAAGCIRKLLDVEQKGSTITSCLEELFCDRNQEKDKCIIQLSENSFGSVAGDSDRRLELGIRQLWLAAFRNHKDMPADTQKKSLLAVPRTKTDETKLHELASLASRLGFESDKLNKILSQPLDRKIAERALLDARKPGRYEFRDLEWCIKQIVDIFAHAVSVSADKTVDRGLEKIREVNDSLNRCGRPNNADYEFNKTRLFLKHMSDDVGIEMGEMTSTFVRWSVYCAYFGPPPLIEDVSSAKSPVIDDIEMEQLSESSPKNNSTSSRICDRNLGAFSKEQKLDEINQEVLGKNIQLENLEESITSKQQSVLELDRKLEELRHHMATERQSNDEERTALKVALGNERKSFENFRKANKAKKSELDERRVNGEGKLNEIIVQLQEKGLELLKLRGDVDNEQTKLDQLTVNQEQGMSETSRLRDAQTQIMVHKSHRYEEFLEYQLMDYNPNEKYQKAIMDITEGDIAKNNKSIPKVCVDFMNYVPYSGFTGNKFVVSDTVVVDPSNPGEVTKIAKKYERKGFSLCKKDGTRITAEKCFEEVRKDGSYLVLIGKPWLSKESTGAIEVQSKIHEDKDKDSNEDEDGPKKKKHKNGNEQHV